MNISTSEFDAFTKLNLLATISRSGVWSSHSYTLSLELYLCNNIHFISSICSQCRPIYWPFFVLFCAKRGQYIGLRTMYIAVGSQRSIQGWHINNGSKTEVQKLNFTCKVSICVQFYNMGCDLQTVIKEMRDAK